MRKLTISSISALVALAISAVALVPVATARPDQQTRSTVTTIQVNAGEFFFRLSKKSIARPGKVTFAVKNAGHVVHDFKINSRKTSLIQPGRTARLVVTFKKKGSYRYLCTVDSHASLGMKGTFTVR
jgi:uncharacterized cupredoxin-like copper-binding protein